MANKTFTKGGSIKGFEPDENDLAMINEQALEPLELSQVYAFEVVACDNDIDRDYERFDGAALRQLAALFVGKTMIKDHQHMSDYQVARVYGSEVVGSEDAKTADGLPLEQLVLRCYMLEGSQIADEIKAGIRREVSVSFRAGSATCSICGNDAFEKRCRHRWGETYDGETCHYTLSDISDAYELSFVAVPAQRNAGTRKDYAEDVPEAEPSGYDAKMALAVRERIADALLSF